MCADRPHFPTPPARVLNLPPPRPKTTFHLGFRRALSAHPKSSLGTPHPQTAMRPTRHKLRPTAAPLARHPTRRRRRVAASVPHRLPGAAEDEKPHQTDLEHNLQGTKAPHKDRPATTRPGWRRSGAGCGHGQVGAGCCGAGLRGGVARQDCGAVQSRQGGAGAGRWAGDGHRPAPPLCTNPRDGGYMNPCAE